MITTQTSTTRTVFTDLQSLSDLTKKALPMKKAMKIERRTPVERVSVLIPKKKQAKRAEDARGIPNIR